MDASFYDRFATLSPEARKHLSFLGLFDTNVDTLTLALFVGKHDESQELYENVMGGSLGHPPVEARAHSQNQPLSYASHTTSTAAAARIAMKRTVRIGPSAESLSLGPLPFG